MERASRVLREICERWGLDALREDLVELERPQQLTVGFLGDFSSGKSTLINAISGVRNLMPSRVEPCTGQAGFVVAVEDLIEPAFYRMDEGGELHPVSRPEFDDLARGRGEGRPVAHVAPCVGLPAGFVLADTPGLASLREDHLAVTLGELPLMDAVVLCVDLQKGGLSKSNLDFLTQPVLAGIRDRLMVALTHGDKRSIADAEKVRTKVIGTLSRALGLSGAVLEERVHITAVVSGDTERIELSALRDGLERLLVAKRNEMEIERRERMARSMVPRAQRLLQEKIQHLGATDEGALARRAALEAQLQEHKGQQEAYEKRLASLQSTLDVELQQVAQRFVAPLADARNDQDLTAVCEQLLERLGATAQELVGEFASRMDIELTSFDSELRSTLRNVNRVKDLCVTVVTAAIVAVVVPGVGPAANAAEAAVGAVGKQAVIKSARLATAKITALKMLAGLAKVVRGLNPAMDLGHILARQVVRGMAPDLLRKLAGDVSRQSGRKLDAVYRTLYFEPAERELRELTNMLAQADSERSKTRMEVNQRIEEAEQDLKRLQLKA